MKQKKFDKLSSEIQKEYLNRGGRIDPDIEYICPEIRWGNKARISKSTLTYIQKLKRTEKKRKKTNPIKEAQRKKKTERIKKLEQYSYELEANLPKSEQWFRKLYKDIKIKTDEWNRPFKKRYIPDVINHQYRYIIEIDGTFHNNLKQKQKDRKKDMFYYKFNYIVFRIEAYNIKEFNKVIKELLIIRKDIKKLKKKYKKDYIKKYLAHTSRTFKVA